MSTEQEEHEFLQDLRREHLVKSTSTTEAVVSLSSAEAEFYAAVKAAAAGICCVSMMRDLGVVLQQQGVEVKAKGLGDGVDSPRPRNQIGRGEWHRKYRLWCYEENYVVVFFRRLGVVPTAGSLSLHHGRSRCATHGWASIQANPCGCGFLHRACEDLVACAPAPVVVVTALDTAISAPNSLTYWDCEDDITCDEQSICVSHRRQPDGQELALCLSLERGQAYQNTDLLTPSSVSMVTQLTSPVRCRGTG